MWNEVGISDCTNQRCNSSSSTSIANVSEILHPVGCQMPWWCRVPQLQQLAWRSFRSLANWERMNSVSPVLHELSNYDLQRNEFPHPFQSSLHMTSGMHVWDQTESSYNVWMQWSRGEEISMSDGWDHSNFKVKKYFQCIMSFWLHQKDYTFQGL